MQGSTALVFAALLAAIVPAAAVEVEENPLGKVMSLIDGLSAKIEKDGEAEAKAYKEFFEWCDGASQQKNFEIETATAKKGKLEASISKSTSDSEASSSKIEELAGSISGSEAELKSATDVRGKEAADFVAKDKELAEVVDTLGRAIDILEREMSKNPAAFAQVDASSFNTLLQSLGAVVDAAAFSSQDRKRLLELVQARQGSGSDDEELGAPAAATYKSHSTDIVDVLQDMKEKAEEELSELRKAETSAKHNFAMLKQSLEDQITVDNKDLSQEKAAKSASEEAKSTAEGDLQRTEKRLADTKQALETAHSSCMQTAADHEATIKAREEELKVIAEAKQILADSTSGAVSRTYSMLQMGKSQLRSRLQTRADLANAEVVTLVKRLAEQQHSSALAQLASHISAVMQYGASAGEDPFVKVKGLIQDLISKLQAEAQSEATEKAYCDEQIAQTEAKKSELDDDIAKLTAKIDQSAAKSASTKEEVKQLQADLAALTKEQAEMDKTRAESHTDYVNSKADLEAGLAGVRKALGVLRTYYGGAAAAAMLQGGSDDMNALMRQPAMPETHSKSTGAGSSIIGILEVCESDFAKNLAEEETEESDAASLYEKTTQENKVTTATKEQDVKYLTQEFKGLDKSISELSTDRESSNSELSAVLEYYAKIKERCIAKPETYEARKGRREAEIAGLKDALRILESEAALLQRGRRSSRQHFLEAARP